MSYKSFLDSMNEDMSNVVFETLPLFTDIDYKYTTTLEDKTYKLHILWLSRPEQWMWSLYDEDDTPILETQVMVNEFPFDPPVGNSDLSGFFMLIGKTSTTTYNFDDLKYNLSDYFNFVYIYTSD